MTDDRVTLSRENRMLKNGFSVWCICVIAGFAILAMVDQTLPYPREIRSPIASGLAAYAAFLIAFPYFKSKAGPKWPKHGTALYVLWITVVLLVTTYIRIRYQVY
jgi:hypothetical protein